MNYKHFFAALAAAFLLFLGAIEVKAQPYAMSTDEIAEYWEDDTQRLQDLVAQNRINHEDLKQFIRQSFYAESYNERLDKVVQVYWDNLPTEERYKVENHKFIDDYSKGVSIVNGLLSFDDRVNFVINNSAKMIEVNTVSKFNHYLRQKLNVDYIGGYVSASSLWEKPVKERKAIVQPYLNQVTKIIPAEKEYFQSCIYADWVYSIDLEPKDYFYWEDIFQSKYENRPHVIDYKARKVVNFPKNKDILNLGLKWASRAAKDFAYMPAYLTQAHILYLLGQKKKAYACYDKVKPLINQNNFNDAQYLEQVAEAIGK